MARPPPMAGPRAPGPAVLVAGAGAAGLAAAQGAVRRATGLPGAAVVGLQYASCGSATDGEVRFVRGRGRGADDATWWEARGCTPAQAMACAADPTAGLLPALGRGAVAAVVGVNREPDIGLGGGSSVTGAAASTVALARQAALAGLPTIAVCLPASSASDTDEDEDDGALAAAAEALEVGGGGTLRNDIIGLTTGASVQAVLAALVEAGLLNPERQAENWPRAHFPFPGLSRWSALGSAQLPVDAALAAGLAEPSSLAEGFASADCWALGGQIAPTSSGDPAHPEPLGRAGLVRTLRQAFAEGDIFLALHVPGARGGQAPAFASTRPGVLWHQTPVASVSNSPQAGAAEDPQPDAPDLYGRSLPLQRVGGSGPSAADARFVRQLQTERLVDHQGTAATAEAEAEEMAFRVGPGVVLHDASPGGDADAVLAGKVAVSTLQTWPQGHAFSLLDAALVEALREAESSGLPAWLSKN